MAEFIEKIVSDEAFKQVQDLKKELDALAKSFEKMLKDMSAMGVPPALKNIPAAVGAASTELAEMQKLKNQIITTNAKLAATETVYGKQLAAAKEAMREMNNQRKIEAQENKAASGSYNQLSAQLRKLEAEYKKMGEAARNSIAGKDVLNGIQQLSNKLKELDANMGVFGRNVGNYRHETFQLTQVLREAPAFAYSAQTGIMALSNNLPMLADAFAKVRKETGSTMKALLIFGKSLFSFANIFSLAIGALSLFSNEILALFNSFNVVTEAAKKFAEIVKEGGATTSAIAEMQKLRKTVDLVKSGVVSKNDALREYNKTVGDTIGKVESWEEAEANIVNKGEAFIQYIQAKTRATALYSKAAEIAAQREVLYLEGPGFLDKVIAAASVLKFTNLYGGEGINSIYSKTLTGIMVKKDYELKQLEDALYKSADEITEMYAELRKQFNFDPFQDDAKGGKAAKQAKAVNRIKELKEQFENELKVTETAYNNGEMTFELYQLALFDIARKWGEKRLSSIKNLSKEEKSTLIDLQLDISKTFKKSIDDLESYVKKVSKEFDAFVKEQNKGTTKDNMLTRMNDELARALELIKQIQSNPIVIDVTTKGSFDEWLDGLENLARDAAKVMRDIGNTISMIGDAIYQSEMNDIDKRADASKKYFEDQELALRQLSLSEEEKEKRSMELAAQKMTQERKFEAERRAAQRQQAIIQKAVSVADVLAGVPAMLVAWGRLLGPAGFAAASILGAAQIAAVLATPIPQFAKGTDNAPEGMAIVGEKGHELVVEPDGKKWITPNTDTLTYLKGGSKVIPNHELMDMVKNSVYAELAASVKPISTDMYGAALVRKFEELSNEVKDLKEVMAHKDMKVNVIGNFDHYMHVRKNIR